MQQSASPSTQYSPRALVRKVAGPLLFLSFFAHHDAPPLLLLDALPRLPGARSPFLAARCCLGYPATHLCAGTCTPTPIACNTRAFVASSLFHNTRNGRVDGHMFGAKEARGEATRLLCLIWPPACVSGYLGGAPKRGSTRYHTSAASSMGGDIKMLQRRNSGALTRCKSKPAGPWPYAPHHSHSTCSHHHSHHEHAACTSELGCARINGRYVSFFKHPKYR